MSVFFNSIYSDLTPYTPGEQPQDKKYVKLNTNESPFPPAPGVIAAINEAEVMDLKLYPDPELKPLKAAIAEAYDVKPENVFIGNGSDECLNFIFMAYGEPGVVYPEISYGFYPVYETVNHLKGRRIPLKEDFTIDLADYMDAEETIIIANPNAPTGIGLTAAQIEELVAAKPGRVVIIDEAYIDFGGESVVGLTKKYNNLLVIQTLSKSRQLAGARVGYVIGDAALIQDLETLKYSSNPYNVSRLSMKAAVEAVKDKEYFERTRQQIIETRAYTVERLREMGFTVLDSVANFIFIRSDDIEGGKLYADLKERGILIRHFTDPKISDYNRVTIGTREQMDIFLAAVAEETGR